MPLGTSYMHLVFTDYWEDDSYR